MDNLVHFPAQLRLVAGAEFPALLTSHRDAEILATAEMLSVATQAVIRFSLTGCEQSLEDAVAALEGSLFHALTLSGARNADIPLRQLLSQRANSKHGDGDAG